MDQRPKFKSRNTETSSRMKYKVGNTLQGFGVDENFLNRLLAAQRLTPSIERWNHLEMKSFCTILKLSPQQATHRIGKKNLYQLQFRQGANI